MSLQPAVIDRLFERLAATYGRDFLARYEGVADAAVKAAWAHELAGFGERLRDIAWALEHLPHRAPNAIEFRALCRMAPAPDVPHLEHAPAAPEVRRAALERIGAAAGGATGDGWARRILAKHARGEPVSRFARNMAADALGASKGCGNGREGVVAC